MMSSPAVVKMERRLASLHARSEAIMLNQVPWPNDWDALMDREGELVERIVAAARAYRRSNGF